MKIKYKVFSIPKRNGTKRIIEQPDPEGMEYLKKHLEMFHKCDDLKPSFFAHAFMHGRNIVTCARQHEGAKYILRMDMKDFFNSITYLNFAQAIPMSAEIASYVLECFKDKRGCTLYLPQGSPTSPFLSNTFMRDFDWKAAWYCHKFNVVYNRYADDIYISTKEMSKKFWSCQRYISDMMPKYGLKENVKKRKLMHQGKKMSVVGVVLNEKFHVDRKTRRIIRAILHKNKKLTNHQKGLINFKEMVEKYDKVVPTNIEVCRSIRTAKAV